MVKEALDKGKRPSRMVPHSVPNAATQEVTQALSLLIVPILPHAYLVLDQTKATLADVERQRLVEAVGQVVCDILGGERKSRQEPKL